MSASVLLGKLLAFSVAGAVAWQASDMLAKALRATPELDLASRIEGGVEIDQAFLERFDATYPEARLDDICDARIRRARVSIALARLDLAVSGDDLERVDAARASVLDQTRRLIGCAPTDGNAWLRLAMVEIADGGLTPAVSAAFTHADRLAPFEGWVLRGRLPFYADLAARGVEAFQEPARRDFARLVEFGTNPASVVALVQRWPDLFRDFYLDRLGRMTVRERRRHYAAADRIGLEIGQPRQPAEIVPFVDPPGAGRRRP